MPIKSTTPRSRSSVPAVAPEQETPSFSPAKGSSKLSPFVIIVIVIVLGTAAVLMLNNAFHGKSPVGTTTEAPTASDDDVAQLIKKVSAHIVVNPSEQPTVATIQDANLLRTQNPQFYKDAQNGDRLLIWSDKAVLYSSSRDVLLAVLPVSLPPGSTGQQTKPPSDETTSTTASATLASEAAKIEVRNGSGIPGLGRTVADSLKSSGLNVLPATEAHVKNYQSTIIVKASDKPLPLTLQALETALHAKVVTLPEGESALKGDFLVIVGSDMQK